MPSLPLREGGNHLLERGIITKSFADMAEVIHIPRSEDKGPAQLEGVLAQLVLTMPGRLGPFAPGRIVAP
jgi:hypothetical protein